jgi:CO dehydrogenase/acetyl-CoA synthase beta subunit
MRIVFYLCTVELEGEGEGVMEWINGFNHLNQTIIQIAAMSKQMMSAKMRLLVAIRRAIAPRIRRALVTLSSISVTFRTRERERGRERERERVC